MARLAAYYQEDFHYPAIHGPKQRKSAYVFYEEPTYDTFYNSSLNNNRQRNLALSEPSLSPLSHTYKPHKMTLKHKPIVYGNQRIANPPPSMQYVDNDHNVCYSDNRFATLPEDMYDNESIFRDDISLYEHRLIPGQKHVSKDKMNKRFSYAEPFNHNYSPEAYQLQNYDKYYYQRQVETPHNGYENRYQHFPDGYFYEAPQTCESPRSTYHYRDISNHKNCPQWSLSPDNMQIDRRLLSPPSPLDSGLSSQSITSSPSLDADSFPNHAESFGVGKYEKTVLCSCPNAPYTDIKRHEPNLSRHDSGRSSGIYSAYGYPKESHQLNNGVKHLTSQTKDDYEPNGYQNSQIRYGKLGLIGEPTKRISTLGKNPKKKLERSQRHENGHKENLHSSYGTENGFVHTKRPSSRMSVTRNQQTKLDRPCVVITEASEKSTESDGAISPDRDKSDKSEDVESSSNASMSDSTSKSSAASCDKNVNRKSNRSTEKEIRELEDMYEKCNLGDADLLDRAERRDLPTVHQMNRDFTAQRLKRSKSDTIYETLSPMFHNPYEIPQRAPPFRRSGLPDRIADDMALRKLKKSTTRSSNGTKNTITYMLCNSHFTPAVQCGKDILFMDYPDVEYDDLSYRSHYFGKKSKVPDPQPPFGIPLRPPPPQKVFSDYLHAIPSNSPQPLCHPRGNPDVVRDDLAVRALRKEEPERSYYDMSQLYRAKRH